MVERLASCGLGSSLTSLLLATCQLVSGELLQPPVFSLVDDAANLLVLKSGTDEVYFSRPFGNVSEAVGLVTVARGFRYMSGIIGRQDGVEESPRATRNPVDTGYRTVRTKTCDSHTATRAASFASNPRNDVQ